MKKLYTKPTSEAIELLTESSLLEDSGTEIKKREQKLDDVQTWEDEDEAEWE